MIQERVRAGLARAGEQGKQLGRPRVDAAVERDIRSALAAGKGIVNTARRLAVGVSTVQRVKATLEGAR
jgi:DNA invertase Pin-like site-specific DNA recombinase